MARSVMIPSTGHSPTGMRVARVIAKLEPGGAQLAALRLTRELERRTDVASRVLAGEASSEGIELARWAGIQVEVWGGASGMQYACEPGFAAWLAPRLAGADLVHAHMFGAWWAAAEAMPAGIPLVASEHNALQWPGEPREAELRAALGRVDLFLAHGPATRETALQGGLAPERIAAGVSTIPDEGAVSVLPLPRPRFVFAGRLHEEKGPDLLLEALALMACPPPTYVLGSGPMAAELIALTRRHGLEPTVHFCGWQRRIGPWLAGAAACVVPSRYEAWSQTAVQAMALGVPVVGTAVEGLPLTLADGRGIVVAPEDPAALARALADVLVGRRRTDLEAGRAYAARFRPDAVADHHTALYRELIERPASPPGQPEAGLAAA
jgi:glycosyltransferase involved in cell wall biosynthesis